MNPFPNIKIMADKAKMRMMRVLLNPPEGCLAVWSEMPVMGGQMQGYTGFLMDNSCSLTVSRCPACSAVVILNAGLGISHERRLSHSA